MGIRLTLVLVAVLGGAACKSPEGVARRTAQALMDAEGARYVSPENYVAADSGFVFVYGCIRHTYDSVAGTLVRSQGTRIDHVSLRVRERLDTARVALTPAQTRAVFDEVDRIGLWAYPREFTDGMSIDTTGAPGEGEVSYSVVPYGTYRLDVRRGGRSASVRWTTAVYGRLTPEAERLRGLGAFLEGILREHPAARALPPPEVICI